MLLSKSKGLSSVLWGYQSRTQLASLLRLDTSIHQHSSNGLCQLKLQFDSQYFDVLLQFSVGHNTSITVEVPHRQAMKGKKGCEQKLYFIQSLNQWNDLHLMQFCLTNNHFFTTRFSVSLIYVMETQMCIHISIVQSLWTTIVCSRIYNSKTTTAQSVYIQALSHIQALKINELMETPMW